MTDGALAVDLLTWQAPADLADRTVIARCTAPVLDVGCGPGRFVQALAERGIAVLGVDIASTCVALTRELGGPALWRSVFDPLPGEGRWPTILVMDGNVGIGADPGRLLARLAQLLDASGRALVELDSEHQRDDQVEVRFLHAGRPLSRELRWARVGVDGLRRYASAAGCYVSDVWSVSGRSFATVMRRPSRIDRTA